jgi:hypothetical protein
MLPCNNIIALLCGKLTSKNAMFAFLIYSPHHAHPLYPPLKQDYLLYSIFVVFERGKVDKRGLRPLLQDLSLTHKNIEGLLNWNRRRLGKRSSEFLHYCYVKTPGGYGGIKNERNRQSYLFSEIKFHTFKARYPLRS